MTDLEMTKLCAKAMGYTYPVPDGHSKFGDTLLCFHENYHFEYSPLRDDAQALALVKRCGLNIWFSGLDWRVIGGIGGDEGDTRDPNLNFAIVGCVAKLQETKTGTDVTTT